MANRDLPNVYMTINDLSALVEGEDSLIVGATLRAARGPIGEAVNVQNSSDFLTKFTFDGKIGAKQDTTFFDIIEVLKASSNVWVSRSANNPLYGGLVIKKEKELGDLCGTDADSQDKIYISGNVTGAIKTGDVLGIYGKDLGDSAGRYGVKSVGNYDEANGRTPIVLTAEFPEALEIKEDVVYGSVALQTKPVAINTIQILEKIEGIIKKGNTVLKDGMFLFKDNIADKLHQKDQIRLTGFQKLFGTDVDDEVILTVEKMVYDETTGFTGVKFFELDYNATTFKFAYNPGLELAKADLITLTPLETVLLTAAQDGSITGANIEVKIYISSMANPANYVFGADDLFLITGADPGAYNSDVHVQIISGKDEKLYTDNAFKLVVTNPDFEELEDYTVSMVMTQKAADGSNIFIREKVNENSAYIRVWLPEDEDIIEAETAPGTGVTPVALGGGTDGFPVTVDNDLEALEVFENKTVPVSLLINGDNANKRYQEMLIGLCQNRKDCFAFLRSSKEAEKSEIITQRVKDIINYKTKTLSEEVNTAWCAAMYGPQIKVQDNFNSRKVKIGADSIACKTWLNVLGRDGFPYAAAGPVNGRVNGATVDWKIGDDSQEAKDLNDNSINFVVYEPRQKFNYFNTQNTLQMANSAFRNVGAVLNILNMKEELARKLKDYIQMPISDSLQEAIVRTIETYMDGCKSANRVSNYFLANNTTKVDISNNELHFVLTLSPAYYAQKIYLVMNVVNAAFDFAILTA